MTLASPLRRRLGAVALALLVLLPLVAPAALVALAPPAFAEDASAAGPAPHATAAPSQKGPDWDAHPAAGVAAAIAIGLLALASFVGAGCAAAILGAMFPRIAVAVDRQARATSPTVPLVVGSLVLIGVAAIVAGASHGGPGPAGFTLVVFGLPAALLVLAGWTATLPLLGERLSGPRGSSASTLRRGIVGSVAIGFGILPGIVVPHLLGLATFVVGMTAFGWPLGVGLAALLARSRKAPAPSPDSPSTPGPVTRPTS